MRSRQSRAAALALAIVLVPASFTTPLFAQGKAATGPSKKDLEAAKKAFFEGLDLEKEEKWDEALKKFEEVSKVRMTPQVRFHIALCKEHMGLLIEALRDFELAESDAKAEKVTTVMQEAPEHAAKIKPRIPKLRIKVPSDAESLSVTLDGNAIDPKGSEEILVNPGTHKIEATAEKRTPFSQEVKLAEGESKTVVVKVPPVGGSKDDDKDKDKDTPPPPPDDKPQPSGGSKIIPGLVVGGVGVVSLLVGGAFYLSRSSVKSDLDANCGEDLKSCPADREDAISKGKTYTTMSNVFGIGGLVLVGVGVVLIVTAPKDETPAPSKTGVRLLPSAPGANVAGLSLSGAF